MMNNNQINFKLSRLSHEDKETIETVTKVNELSELEETTENNNFKPGEQGSKEEITDIKDRDEQSERFKFEIERFIEISKYFSNPLKKTASYICENSLVSYPRLFRIEYKRGCVTTLHMKFTNLTLEPVYIRLYKLIPDLEQLKFINLSLSRCKRIPPGLSFTLGFIYDDVNEKPSCNSKVIFVASRKTTTPCYQVCEIELQVAVKK